MQCEHEGFKAYGKWRWADSTECLPGFPPARAPVYFKSYAGTRRSSRKSSDPDFDSEITILDIQYSWLRGKSSRSPCGCRQSRSGRPRIRWTCMRCRSSSSATTNFRSWNSRLGAITVSCSARRPRLLQPREPARDHPPRHRGAQPLPRLPGNGGANSSAPSLPVIRAQGAFRSCG